MRNKDCSRMLNLDPRIHDLFHTEVTRHSDEFKQLMDIVARTESPAALFLPVAAVIIAVGGERTAQLMNETLAMVQLSKPFIELQELLLNTYFGKETDAFH